MSCAGTCQIFRRMSSEPSRLVHQRVKLSRVWKVIFEERERESQAQFPPLLIPFVQGAKRRRQTLISSPARV